MRKRLSHSSNYPDLIMVEISLESSTGTEHSKVTEANTVDDDPPRQEPSTPVLDALVNPEKINDMMSRFLFGKRDKHENKDDIRNDTLKSFNLLFQKALTENKDADFESWVTEFSNLIVKTLLDRKDETEESYIRGKAFFVAFNRDVHMHQLKFIKKLIQRSEDIVSDLNRDLAVAIQDKGNLRTQYQDKLIALKKQVTVLRKKLDASEMNQQLKALEKEVQIQCVKLKNAEATKLRDMDVFKSQQEEAVVRPLKRELRQVQGDLESAQKKLTEYRETKWQKVVDDKVIAKRNEKKAVTDLQSFKKVSKKQIAKLKKTLEDKQVLIDALISGANEYDEDEESEDECVILEQQKMTLNKEVSSLKIKLEEEQAHIRKLKLDLQMSNQSVAYLKRANPKTDLYTTTLRKDYQKLEATNKQLHKKVKQLSEENTILKSDKEALANIALPLSPVVVKAGNHAVHTQLKDKKLEADGFQLPESVCLTKLTQHGVVEALYNNKSNLTKQAVLNLVIELHDRRYIDSWAPCSPHKKTKNHIGYRIQIGGKSYFFGFKCHSDMSGSVNKGLHRQLKSILEQSSRFQAYINNF